MPRMKSSEQVPALKPPSLPGHKTRARQSPANPPKFPPAANFQTASRAKTGKGAFIASLCWVQQRDEGEQPCLPPAQQSSCAGTNGTAGAAVTAEPVAWQIKAVPCSAS